MPDRTKRSGDKNSAAEFLPKSNGDSLSSLALAAAGCQGCELYRDATQTVFGAGGRRAPLMLIGEQPGDVEDRQGKPFVGPAGILLRAVLAECSVTQRDYYVTNSVKHFRWIPRGKKRLHAKPLMRHVNACKPWLDAEVGALRPKVIVCLGATAAQSCFGSSFRLLQQRGKVLTGPWGQPTVCTYHPSAILRAPDQERRAAMREAFRQDLERAIALIATGEPV
jgi:DNA polymerase